MRLNTRYTNIHKQIWYIKNSFYTRQQRYLSTTLLNYDIRKSIFVNSILAYPMARNVTHYRLWTYPEILVFPLRKKEKIKFNMGKELHKLYRGNLYTKRKK